MEFAMFALAGINAVGAVVEGAQEYQNMGAVIDTAEINELYSRQGALDELRVATRDQELIRRRGAQANAEEFAKFAQSGFGVNNFSTQTALAESRTNVEIDALTARYQGQTRARAKRIEAEGFRQQADAAKIARKGIPFKTALNVGTALLSGYKNSVSLKLS